MRVWRRCDCSRRWLCCIGPGSVPALRAHAPATAVCWLRPCTARGEQQAQRHRYTLSTVDGPRPHFLGWHIISLQGARSRVVRHHVHTCPRGVRCAWCVPCVGVSWQAGAPRAIPTRGCAALSACRARARCAPPCSMHTQCVACVRAWRPTVDFGGGRLRPHCSWRWCITWRCRAFAAARAGACAPFQSS
jgi:hypothetical protein